MFDLLDCLILQDIKQVGYKTILRLNNNFRSIQDIWESPRSELEKIIGRGEAIDNILKSKIIDKKKYAFLVNAAREKEIQMFCIFDDDYPNVLKELNDPPLILYVKGEIPKDINKNIAIVGTRNLTYHGNRVVRDCSKALAEKGYIIVSGLARGADTTAHLGALDGGGKTIAVFGGGVDIIYPPENDELSKDIINKGGALISEYPLGAKHQDFRLRDRNRLISCLSKAIIATEVKEKTGTSITIRHSIQLGRKVFIIPTVRQSSVNYTNYQQDIVHLGAVNVLNPTDVLDNLVNDKGFIKINEFFNFISNNFEITHNIERDGEFKDAYSINKQNLVKNCGIEEQSFNSTNRAIEKKDGRDALNKCETNFNTSKESGSIEDSVNKSSAIDTNLTAVYNHGYANYGIKGNKEEIKKKKANKKRENRKKQSETNKSAKLSMYSLAD